MQQAEYQLRPSYADPHRDIGDVSGRWLLAAAVLLSAVGLWCFAYQLGSLWQTWTNDGLRSIGVMLPPVSLWLALRAWRGEAWDQRGNWWGLALIVAAMLAARLTSDSYFDFSFYGHSAHIGINFLPLGLQLWAYASGIVLLFGGTRAWRTAWFALALLLFVNPVPRSFQSLVDLPLQYVAAHTARVFAAMLTVPVGGDQLRLMFSPALGMFIAPGCDGLRGAAAMGYLALIVGHLYHLPRLWHAAYVTSAVAAAYLFNLLRLCALVLFYWLALRIVPLQNYALAADYIIGALLFFLAAGSIFYIPRFGFRR